MENDRCVLYDDTVGKNGEGLCDECAECLEPTYLFSESDVVCLKEKKID